MANYVKYRDIAGAIKAGHDLEEIGATFSGAVESSIDDIQAGERTALKGSDKYSREFDPTYRASGPGGPRNSAVLTYAQNLKKPISELGHKVVLSASSILYVDAAHGASMNVKFAPPSG